MFGSDDTNAQQPGQDTSGVMPAVMPDPIAPIIPAPDAGFNIPASPPTPTTQDISIPEVSVPTTPDLPAGLSDPLQPIASPAPAGNGDLIDLKQQALQHLSPLVSHLDQTPEEKFRTTMMMIQASDDHSLIKSAFEAAQLITDDKARAQALLDVINEINYFTQHQS